MSGNATIWWFNDYDSPDTNHYSIVSTLTASAPSGGSYTYQILVGSDKAGLGPDLASSYVSSSNQVEVKSRKGSDNQNDIGITVTVNGRTSAIFYMTVRRPKYLRLDNGFPQYGLYNGYPISFETDIEYTVVDNLDEKMPYDLPVNEYFTTGFSADFSGTNWGQPTPHAANTFQSTFTDHIGVWETGFGGLYPDPHPPDTPLSSTRVGHFTQQFWVGTLGSGTGVLVQQNTFVFFVDHGAHENVVSPVP